MPETRPKEFFLLKIWLWALMGPIAVVEVLLVLFLWSDPERWDRYRLLVVYPLLPIFLLGIGIIIRSNIARILLLFVSAAIVPICALTALAILSGTFVGWPEGMNILSSANDLKAFCFNVALSAFFLAGFCLLRHPVVVPTFLKRAV